MDCAGIFYSAQAVPAAYALPVFPFPPTTMINAALFGRLDDAFDNGWLRHRTYGGVSIGANIIQKILVEAAANPSTTTCQHIKLGAVERCLGGIDVDLCFYSMESILPPHTRSGRSRSGRPVTHC